MSLQNKEYKLRDLVAAGMKLPTAETCKPCHNNSLFYKAFNYQVRVHQGIHAHEPLKYKHD